MQSIRFILYEPSFLIRKGLITVIDKIANSKLIAQADNEEELTELLNQEDIDILIVNESAFESKEIVKQMKHLRGVQIIGLTVNNVHKIPYNIVADTLKIEDSQKIILKKINTLISNNISKKNIEKKPDEISNRETDILKYIALGFSNKEIADKLFLSAHTVVTHRKNITRKLGIKTVPGLTIYAIINKIIDINETEKLNPDTHK
jgi:DNA-binding NarL/FixJ family response regulator